MFCFAMAGQSRRVMGPEGAIMRTDIALLAGMSGGVDLEAFFYLRCKATSGKGAGVHFFCMPGLMPFEFCKLGESFATLCLRANIDLGRRHLKVDYRAGRCYSIISEVNA